MHAITTLQRSVRIVQVGLILFLLLFSRFLGVSRKQISFGISLGFGLFAGVELMLWALNSGGFVRQGIFNLINMFDLQFGHFGLARLLALAQSRARGRRQPPADPALGAGLGGSSTPRSFRFADPDVRRHGGARVFAQLEFGVKRQIICRSTAPVIRPEPTRPPPVPRLASIALAAPSTASCRNLVKRIFGRPRILLRGA